MPKQWTPKTLLEFFTLRMDLSMRLLDERFATQTKATDKAFDAQQQAMKTAFDAADKAVQAALTAAEKAVEKAEKSTNERLAATNEFREQQKDIINGFLPRPEFDAQYTAITEKLDTLGARMNDLDKRLTSRLDLVQGKEEGSSKGTELRQRASGITAQWVAILFLAIGLLTTVVLAVITHVH